MIERIIFRPAAEHELKEAYKWYEQRDAGLGTGFLALGGSMPFENPPVPEIFPVAYKNVRQGLVRRFPYSILYILAGANLIVISVFHSARDPEIWQQRV